MNLSTSQKQVKGNSDQFRNTLLKKWMSFPQALCLEGIVIWFYGLLRKKNQNQKPNSVKQYVNVSSKEDWNALKYEVT